MAFAVTSRICIRRPSVVKCIVKRLLSTKEKEAERQAMIDKFLRVDHAGEFGADKIYAGQLAVLGPKGVGPLPFMPDAGGRKVSAEETGQLIQHMWDQEKHHLATFDKLYLNIELGQLLFCHFGMWLDLPLELGLHS